MQDFSGMRETEAEIWCPFWHGQTARCICCEGVTEDSRLFLTFRSGAARQQHTRIFCATDHCTYCELYPAIAGRFEDA